MLTPSSSSLSSWLPLALSCSPNTSGKTVITFDGCPVKVATSFSFPPTSNQLPSSNDSASELKSAGESRGCSSHSISNYNHSSHFSISDGISGDVDIVGLLYNLHDM
ncbi:hypothetical protein L202_05054 [Cryptococcus amylolentus CBS 6039]|uniref:Uncharacterized protein n=1 Tax=Cryptococcus amylolentus CBS 6039 TaxID=1295533 RepID=A0A1E3HR88_9TREE|nr:hypothetical protein L202_05054 [Cryptococcus amylolentus CBS 6039]ODN77961.1 hypothetical protein L202_05054 [Cryptococcus amylolentus CBS 6039]